jgi:IS5 family transposase
MDEKAGERGLKKPKEAPPHAASGAGDAQIRPAALIARQSPKRRYGWRRARYRGLARNGVHLHLLCTALNLRRRAERLAA